MPRSAVAKGSQVNPMRLVDALHAECESRGLEPFARVEMVGAFGDLLHWPGDLDANEAASWDADPAFTVSGGGRYVALQRVGGQIRFFAHVPLGPNHSIAAHETGSFETIVNAVDFIHEYLTTTRELSTISVPRSRPPWSRKNKLYSTT